MVANDQNFMRRSYLIKAISPKAKNEIINLQIQFYKDLTSIIELDKEEDLDQVLLLSVVSLVAKQ